MALFNSILFTRNVAKMGNTIGGKKTFLNFLIFGLKLILIYWILQFFSRDFHSGARSQCECTPAIPTLLDFFIIL